MIIATLGTDLVTSSLLELLFAAKIMLSPYWVKLGIQIQIVFRARREAASSYRNFRRRGRGLVIK